MKKQRETDQMTLAGSEEGEILARLTERVEKAIATIQELRRERDALRSRVEKAEADLRTRTESADRLTELEGEQERLRRERTEIRNRIEHILNTLEGLEGEAE
ncbi:MAG TPA: cell division protein ZapB [Thermoanaerobaculia bacterium]|nr:cell division protein ZapB [Thermoanaerobaculia bacterium]